MERVIARLRREKEETKQQWFDEGKKEGWDFAKGAHYRTLQQVLSWDALDTNFGDRLEATFQEGFSELREEMGVRDDESLDDSPMFFEWAKGFMEGVTKFWNEVADKL